MPGNECLTVAETVTMSKVFHEVTGVVSEDSTTSKGCEVKLIPLTIGRHLSDRRGCCHHDGPGRAATRVAVKRYQ
mgnify:CR=1 FL=1